MATLDSLQNGINLQSGDRDDLAAADVMTLQLDSNTGITSFAWSLVARPEFSIAGGPAGAEPIDLGNESTATFTADSDDVPNDILMDGTYNAQVILNDGGPTREVLTARLSRLTLGTIPGPGGGTSGLRRMSAIEPFQGAAPLRQFRIDLNRWFDRIIRNVAGGAPIDPNLITLTAGVVVSAGDPIAIDTATGNGVVASAAGGVANPDLIAVATTGANIGLTFQARTVGDVTTSAGGLAIGEPVYLSIVGGFTSTAPVASGQFEVRAGTAITGQRISLVPTEAIFIP